MPGGIAGHGYDGPHSLQRPPTVPGSGYDSQPYGSPFDDTAYRRFNEPAASFGGSAYNGPGYSGSTDRGLTNGNSQYRNSQYGNSQYRNSSYGGSSFQAPDPRRRPLQPVGYRSDVSVKWESDFRTGVQHSLQSGLPLLVQVSADWCGYCQKMKQETLVDPTVIRTLNRGFVTVMLDADANRELVQQLNVKSLPTTLVILPNGRVVENLNGYQSASALQTMLNRYQQRVQLETDRRIASR